MQIEVTGWNAENESVETSGEIREDETEDEAVQRLCVSWDIVEIGDVRVYG